MKKFQHLSKLFSLSLLLCFGLFSTNATANPIDGKYSGEDLVRGILLVDGPVANAIEGLQEFSVQNFTSDSEIKSAISNYHDEVMAEIKSSNPDFFDSFKAQIDTRKHASIRAAIEDGKHVVLAAMNKVDDQSNAKMDAETQQLAKDIKAEMSGASDMSQAAAIAQNYLASTSHEKALAPASAIAVETATIAVATRVAMFVYTEYYFWPSEINAAPSNNRIFQESIIDAVATRL